MKMTRKKTLHDTSPTEIARQLRLSSRLADFAITSCGVTVTETICSPKIDALDFATKLEAIMAKPGFSKKLGLISLRQLADRMVSPPELLVIAEQIGFVAPIMFARIAFWPLDKIDLQFVRCGSGWITIRQLAERTGLTIAQLSRLVIEGHLPKITARCFVPGWCEDDLKLFLSQGDWFGIGEADQYDIECGRIYPILDAPPPWRALDKTAAIDAFFGSLGHPLRLANGSYGWVAEHMDVIRFRSKKSAEPLEDAYNRRTGQVKKINRRPLESRVFVEVTDEMLIGLLCKPAYKLT